MALHLDRVDVTGHGNWSPVTPDVAEVRDPVDVVHDVADECRLE